MAEESYSEIPLGQVITSISRGIQLTAEQLENCITDKETGYRYLSLADIQDGLSLGINYQDLRHFDPSKTEKDVDKFCVSHNMLLLTKNDTPFKITIIGDTSDLKVVVAGNIYMISANEDKIIPRWLCYWLQSEEGSARLRSFASLTNGGRMRWISKKQIECVPIPKLTFSEQTVLLEKKLQEYTEWMNKLTAEFDRNFNDILEILSAIGLRFQKKYNIQNLNTK